MYIVEWNRDVDKKRRNEIGIGIWKCIFCAMGTMIGSIF